MTIRTGKTTPHTPPRARARAHTRLHMVAGPDGRSGFLVTAGDSEAFVVRMIDSLIADHGELFRDPEQARAAMLADWRTWHAEQEAMNT